MFFFKSHLLRMGTKNIFLYRSFKFLIISTGSFSSTTKAMLQLEISLLVFSIPISSILFRVFRIPAVSNRLMLFPFKFSLTSITSRVVPFMFVTIALSYPTMQLNKEDFPAFGFPTITTRGRSFSSS